MSLPTSTAGPASLPARPAADAPARRGPGEGAAVLLGAGACLVVGSSVAISDGLTGYPVLGGQALRYGAAAALLAVPALMRPWSASWSVARHCCWRLAGWCWRGAGPRHGWCSHRYSWSAAPRWFRARVTRVSPDWPGL